MYQRNSVAVFDNKSPSRLKAREESAKAFSVLSWIASQEVEIRLTELTNSPGPRRFSKLRTAHLLARPAKGNLESSDFYYRWMISS